MQQKRLKLNMKFMKKNFLILVGTKSLGMLANQTDIVTGHFNCDR